MFRAMRRPAPARAVFENGERAAIGFGRALVACTWTQARRQDGLDATGARHPDSKRDGAEQPDGGKCAVAALRAG